MHATTLEKMKGSTCKGHIWECNLVAVWDQMHGRHTVLQSKRGKLLKFFKLYIVKSSYHSIYT